MLLIAAIPLIALAASQPCAPDHCVDGTFYYNCFYNEAQVCKCATLACDYGKCSEDGTVCYTAPATPTPTPYCETKYCSQGIMYYDCYYDEIKQGCQCSSYYCESQQCNGQGTDCYAPQQTPTPAPTPACPNNCQNGIFYSNCYYDAVKGCSCLSATQCDSQQCNPQGTACAVATPTPTPRPTATATPIPRPTFVITPPPTPVTGCMNISGRITNFIYPIESLRIVVARMNDAAWVNAPPKADPLRYLTGETYNASIRFGGEFDLVYNSPCLRTSGTYLVYPLYVPNTGDCGEWESNWNVSDRIVSVRRESVLNVNFIYIPSDARVPSINFNYTQSTPLGWTPLVRFPPEPPLNFTMTASDESGISKTGIILETMSGTPIQDANCTGSTCAINNRNFTNTTERIRARAYACDNAGNKATATLDVPISSCYNLVQDGRETGVDCGGPCTPCISCTWCGTHITPIIIHGRPTDGYIDVVFVADNTYTGHSFSDFVTDAKRVIKKGYYTLDQRVTSPLPADYRNKFNFYYWNTVDEHAASGMCSWPAPDGYETQATFADNMGLLYYTSGDLSGCANGWGNARFRTPGRLVSERAGEKEIVGQALHESGHAIFGLSDTYCGRTAYHNIPPHANAWTSLANCQTDIASRGWDTTPCRAMGGPSDTDCRGWFRYDLNVPDPEMMEWGFEIYGPAGTARINWTLAERFRTG